MDLPIETAEDLENWLIAAGELNAMVGQEGVERYIAMTCQTDDPDRESAYLAFVREIEPKLKPIQNDDPEPVPRLAASRGAAARSLLRLRPRPGESCALFREANIPARRSSPSLSSSTRRSWGR